MSKYNGLYKGEMRFRAITVVLVLIFLAIGGFIYYQVYLPQQAANSESQAQQNTTANTEPLAVEVIKPERTVRNPFTEVTVISNHEITFDDHNRISETKYIGEEDDQHYYIVSISNIPLVGAEVTLRGQNSAGETFQQKVEIKKEAFSIPAGLDAVSSWPDAEYILDASKLDVTVNRNNRIREDYEPEVIDLNKEFGIYTLNNAALRSDAARALDSMLKALREETGITDITVVSGYRSYETQVTTYSYWVRTLGEQRANKISARPGHSEHQLGTTVDFSTVALGYDLSESFGDTQVGKWLANNAARFGFKQFNDPNFSAEPWQFRWYGYPEGEIENE